MPVTFVAYIDESGDTGLDLVKKPDAPQGATEWLVLGAMVVRIEHDARMVSWVQDVQAEFTSKRADLHFNKLLDFKKTLVCTALAKKPCQCFVVMSNKKNIEKYRNSRLDDGNKSWIYWFLARLLLERITVYCESEIPKDRRGKDKLRIVFSRRGGMNYKDFSDYLWKLYWQTGTNELVLYYKIIKWPVIDFEEIFVLDHVAQAGLQLADVVAGAFYQGVEMNRGGGQTECDPSYARDLKPVMAFKKTPWSDRWYLGVGVKPMPSLREMNLATQQRKLFEFYGAKASDWEQR